MRNSVRLVAMTLGAAVLFACAAPVAAPSATPARPAPSASAVVVEQRPTVAPATPRPTPTPKFVPAETAPLAVTSFRGESIVLEVNENNTLKVQLNFYQRVETDMKVVVVRMSPVAEYHPGRLPALSGLNVKVGDIVIVDFKTSTFDPATQSYETTYVGKLPAK